MKKLIILLGGSLCGMLCWMCSTNPKTEIFIPQEYRHIDMQQRKKVYEAWGKVDPALRDRMVSALDTLKFVYLLPINLQIMDILTEKEVIDVYDRNDPMDGNKFAIYTLNMAFPRRRQLLFFNHGEFTVFDVDDYPRVLKKIAHYFRKHKEVDTRLLPFCIQEATKIYVQNGRSCDQYGPWRHWWGKNADSLGRIYNEHLQF